MGSVGGKTPTEIKVYSFFSNLRQSEQDKVEVHGMGDKIRRRA
jgi:hypothetical protein